MIIVVKTIHIIFLFLRDRDLSVNNSIGGHNFFKEPNNNLYPKIKAKKIYKDIPQIKTGLLIGKYLSRIGKKFEQE